ncbi:hypothetical protein BGZ94_004204 [Podila epigama]|nr:hypothetical protein BGZ94_004204 [Podila epigama]
MASSSTSTSQRANSNHHTGNSHDNYNNSSSATSSKQASPAPSNRSDSNSEYPAMKGSKGKLFQCTGFGDCRMVFTRSEHLARHARKHTGEKPFQCVVDGCTRMFSRFDNMVQHTQTHTKGARRESSVGIASKIAAESRRKSDAGLLSSTSSSGRGATAGKVTKAKRGSVSSGPANADVKTGGRKKRIQSMPMLNFTSPKEDNTLSPSSTSSSMAVPLSPVTASSKSSSPSSYASKKNSGRIKKDQTSLSSTSSSSPYVPIGRRASIASSTGSSICSGMSWYASKLHHSFDDGLSQYGRGINLDSRLPPLGNGRGGYMDQGYNRSRHPLSPERSLHSEDDDEGSYDDNDDMQFQHQHRDDRYRAQWGGMVDSMDHVTLPPLQSSTDSYTLPTRLPSISSTGYSSHYNNGVDRIAPAVRRLSLAELEMPIVESTMTTLGQPTQEHHSLPRQDYPEAIHPLAKEEGVDVSEDELHALEAFGRLWSQGRVYSGMPAMAQQSDLDPSNAMMVRVKTEQPDLLAPGLDHGRRSPRGNRDTMHHHLVDESKSTMAMDVD